MEVVLSFGGEAGHTRLGLRLVGTSFRSPSPGPALYPRRREYDEVV